MLSNHANQHAHFQMIFLARLWHMQLLLNYTVYNPFNLSANASIKTVVRCVRACSSPQPLPPLPPLLRLLLQFRLLLLLQSSFGNVIPDVKVVVAPLTLGFRAPNFAHR
jgi:hypothetical protein